MFALESAHHGMTGVSMTQQSKDIWIMGLEANVTLVIKH